MCSQWTVCFHAFSLMCALRKPAESRTQVSRSQMGNLELGSGHSPEATGHANAVDFNPRGLTGNSRCQSVALATMDSHTGEPNRSVVARRLTRIESCWSALSCVSPVEAMVPECEQTDDVAVLVARYDGP